MPDTAELITALRTEKGLSQEELAKLLFVSRSLVSMWEL
ncbi:MAG: helix-turn-helix transcriptional regulator, partial [Clostridia bacterium]|nr:helix-turn-helix transcriptional regulator [Clostridia bacterium]